LISQFTLVGEAIMDDYTHERIADIARLGRKSPPRRAQLARLPLIAESMVI
jgi:hypothetical protein